MNRIIKNVITAFILQAIVIGGLAAQSIDFIFIDRAVRYHQTGPDTTILSPWDPPYVFWAGFDGGDSSSITSATISNGTTINSSIPDEGDGLEFEMAWDTLSEFETAVGYSGPYTLSGNANGIGDFSIQFILDNFDPLPVYKITNYNELVNLDPSQSFVVNWETPSDVDIIEIDVSYWDPILESSIDLFEEELETVGSSITIPANTFVGSTNSGYYNLNISFYRIESIKDSTTFTGAKEAVTTIYELLVEINLDDNQTATWGGFPIDSDGNINTGSLFGWANVNAQPFIYSYTLNSWFYANEPANDAGGLWAYVMK